ELEKQYPGYGKLFNPPASEDLIAAHEKLTGLSMPQEWKELYAMHNGQKRPEKYGLAFFFSLPFLTLEESMEQWKFLNHGLTDTSLFDVKSHSVPADHIRERYVDSGWVPISNDSGGNYIGIDLHPDIKGTYGQVINFGRDEDTKYVIASGLEAFFTYMLTLIRVNKLSIIAQDDDDADEEEDDDGNILPLPKVYRFAFNGLVIWHFLDWLKVLDLPGKPELTDVDKNYHSWLDIAPDNWRALIDANCNFQGLGFVAPAYITRFYPGKLPVDDLKYIHYFKNVREVILSGTKLKEVPELESLPLIKVLFLSNSAVEDINPLKNLKRLRDLSLNKLNITDLSALQDLPLIELNLEHTKVRDLKSVSEIVTLEKLNISYTKISSGEALVNLTGLRSLNISGSAITYLSFLDRIKWLKELAIYGLETDNYEPLFRSTNITNVTCSFDVFRILRKAWTHKVNFAIQGEMTDAEMEEWRRLR
ncbi:MAG: hypothetical protein C0490_17510, partial [Marivirga sp.]|nr:hypothetical protein [Marivirga sp.]